MYRAVPIISVMAVILSCGASRSEDGVDAKHTLTLGRGSPGLVQIQPQPVGRWSNHNGQLLSVAVGLTTDSEVLPYVLGASHVDVSSGLKKIPTFELFGQTSSPVEVADFLSGRLALRTLAEGDQVRGSSTVVVHYEGKVVSYVDLAFEPDEPLDPKAWYVLFISDIPESVDLGSASRAIAVGQDRTAALRFSLGSHPTIQRVIAVPSEAKFYFFFSERVFSSVAVPKFVAGDGLANFGCEVTIPADDWSKYGADKTGLQCASISLKNDVLLQIATGLSSESGEELISSPLGPGDIRVQPKDWIGPTNGEFDWVPPIW